MKMRILFRGMLLILSWYRTSYTTFAFVSIFTCVYLYISFISTSQLLILWKISRAVYDVEEATTKAFEIILEHKVDYNIIFNIIIVEILAMCGCFVFVFSADD